MIGSVGEEEDIGTFGLLRAAAIQTGVSQMESSLARGYDFRGGPHQAISTVKGDGLPQVPEPFLDRVMRLNQLYEAAH